MTTPRRDDRPPAVNRVPIPIVNYFPGVPVCFRLLGSWKGYWLHWVPGAGFRGRGQSLPCTAPNCPHCPKPHIWRAYAPTLMWVEEKPSGGRWVDAVCPLMAEHVETLKRMQKQGLELRGLVISIQKELKRSQFHNPHVAMKVLEERTDDALPAEWDVEPIMLRAWRLAFAVSQDAVGHQEEEVEEEVPSIMPFPQPAGVELPPPPRFVPQPQPAPAGNAPPSAEQWQQFRDALKGIGGMPTEQVQDAPPPKPKATGPAPKPAGRSKPRKPRRKPG